MTFEPDKRELADQIADAMQEAVDVLPRFYGSTCTTADCCKLLIEPLLSDNNIEDLLRSLPPNDAKSLRRRYDALMSCFDRNGDLLDASLKLVTVKRYVRNLVKELRNAAEEVAEDTATVQPKAARPGPRAKHSDEKLQLVLASFEQFRAEGTDATQARNKTAQHHGFPSGKAARQACYRLRQKRNK